MDKFLKQLKEKFEFEFISHSIYQVGLKILDLIKSGDYGSFQQPDLSSISLIKI